MINKIFSLLARKNAPSVEQIESLPSLHGLTGLHEKYLKLSSKRALRKKISESNKGHLRESQHDIKAYLDQIFEMQILVLRSSIVDAKFNQVWVANLREMLVKIPYTGKYLEAAKKLKEDLDAGHDLDECTKRAKQLLMNHANSAYDDQQEIYQFLQDISEKLQTIYSEINEAQESCTHNQSRQNLRTSFERGMQDLKTTIDASGDVHTLKNTLNQLVDALQYKVEKDFEQEENETQILQEKIAGLSNKVKSLEEHSRELENTIRKKHEEAITDPLTKLFNRAAYIQALEKAWLQWREENIQSTLLVWDIDHFKLLNDRYGHAAGDKVLQSVALKLKSNVDEGDIVARFGGEEFVMLLIDKGLKEGEQLAEHVRELIATTDFTYKQQPIQVTISCGVASFTQKDTPTTLFERADKALYKAKRSGRNKVEVFANVA